MSNLDLNLVDQMLYDCLNNRDRFTLNILEDYLKEQNVEECRIFDLKQSVLMLAKKISREYYPDELVDEARKIYSFFIREDLEEK